MDPTELDFKETLRSEGEKNLSGGHWVYIWPPISTLHYPLERDPKPVR